MIPNPQIARLSTYALADMTPPKGKRLISLAQNESLRPPSPQAIAAGQAMMAQVALYPDPDWTELRAALADIHGLAAQDIVCGAGSLDLIAAVTRIYCGADRAMLAPAHAYPFFASAAALAGARCETAPETDCTVDIDALMAAVTPQTGLVCLANPGNPTGTWLPPSQIARLRDGLRDDILLLVDEAYGEFVPRQSGAAFDLVPRGNTLVLRTFSKAYGLAALRIGWALAPPRIAGEMRKVLNPNNVSAPAQSAACAALRDQAYMRETVDQIARLRTQVKSALCAAGLKVFPSVTNFLLIDLETAERAAACDAALRAEGVFLRPQGGAGLPQMLRMTLGPPQDVAIAQALLCELA